MAPIITAAVEGPTDEAVARKLVAHVGAQPGTVHGKQGKPHLRQQIDSYNHAARRTPWLILVDLDRDADCAPPFVQAWLPRPAPFLCLRVAVRAVEAWLLADAERLAAFLGVAAGRIVAQPEQLDDPKQAMVDLAGASRRRDILADMVPRAGSGRKVGPAYTSRLIEFVTNHWRPEAAARRAESLARTIRCLSRLAETAT